MEAVNLIEGYAAVVGIARRQVLQHVNKKISIGFQKKIGWAVHLRRNKSSGRNPYRNVMLRRNRQMSQQ